jgi:hypothetical protein
MRDDTAEIVDCIDQLVGKLELPGADPRALIRQLYELEQLAVSKSGGRIGPLLVTLKREVQKSMSPFKPFVPAKPSLAGLTEIFSTTELWDWAKDKLPVAIEPKWNGFRVIVEKKGDRLKMWTEGNASRNLFETLPNLKTAFAKIPGSWIFDADLGIEKEGKRLARPELMRLNSDKPVFVVNEVPVVTLFDMPYYADDLSELPFVERRKQLEELPNSFFDDRFIRLSPVKWVDTHDKLVDAVHQAYSIPRSEGAMAKTASGPYPVGETNEWSKVKKVAELKVQVLDTKDVAGGMYNYRGGLSASPSDGWENVTLAKDGFVDLGWSFNTKVKAKVGDIITVRVLELIPDEEKKTLVWLGANVMDVDPTRKAPYAAKQAIDIAQRGSVLQDKEVKKAAGEEGDTHGESAEKFWRDNWFRTYPKSGNGRFVYQHHWRGLLKNDELDETGLSDAELMKTDHSVHGDLRFEADDALWGFSAFIGTTDANRKGDRLEHLPPDDKLQGTFKLAQPKPWLDVGVRAPLLVEPAGVGATANTYAKFFALDHGTYQMGVRHRHFAEVFVHGDKLDGRYIIASVPMGPARRVWMIGKPVDQTPMAESQKLEDVVADLKKRGHDKLIWAKPGTEPELIELKTVKNDVTIVTKNAKKRLVTGLVMEPDELDTQDEYASSEVIEQAAHNYLVKSRAVGVQHAQQNPHCFVVESWVAPVSLTIEGRKIKQGSWMMTVKVSDDETWNKVEKGELTGFSIGGLAEKAIRPLTR